LGAHQLQQCNNFKDPGVQHYGGRLFQEIRDKVDEEFSKLPPPTPSRKTSSYSSSSPSSYSGPVASMSVYNSSSAPCFSGISLVQTPEGTKKVENMKKGDFVCCGKGVISTVECVVKTTCDDNKTSLVDIDGLLVTPYHPIKINEKWCFPCDIAEASERNCSAVYSFVLGGRHSIIINDIECITLGHGVEDDIVASHSYFGTDLVLSDLKNMRGWETGLVELQSGCLVRDEVSGLVTSLTQFA